jgi:hypothetical protein
VKTQQRQLEALLTREGWVIVARELSPEEWWLDEVWVLESVWTPAGRRIFVSFLVDPHAVGERPKGEHVWAVVATATRPVSRLHSEPDVPLRPHWERDRRDEIMSHVRSLRSRVPGEAG